MQVLGYDETHNDGEVVHNDLKYAQWRVRTMWEIDLKIHCLPARSLILLRPTHWDSEWLMQSAEWCSSLQ